MTAPNFAPGTPVAGKFTIRSLLGHNGSTATFRAVSADGREVALKIYSPAIGQRPDTMGQLQQYVAATNALPADLVGHVLEAGYDQATAAPFTITEFIANPSLAQLVMRRPLSADEVSAVLRTLAAVLDASHARDMFHLGIKPTNLFVDANAPGNLKVTDFGTTIARSTLPTQEGYLIAAPWMAPEQVQGGMPLGAAADIFSAALVAFFALVGRPYWRSCQGVPDLNVWQRELVSPRASASARAAELGAPLDPGLDPIFARALAVDPRERYRTMGEFAAAFGGFPTGLGQAATLAFPSQGGAYGAEPGPPQGGGYPGAGGYPPAPTPGMQLQGMQPQGGVPAAAPFEPELPPSALQTHVPMPGMGIPGGAPRTATGRAMPIVVGLAAVLLAGGGVAAFMLMGDDSGGPAPAASASASASAESPATPATPPSATSTETPTPADTAATDAGVEPPPAADAGPATVSVTITCKPEACEEITVNTKKVEGGDLQLAPGSYSIGVKRAGYFPKSELVKVEADKPLEKEITLTVIPKGPAPGPGPVKKDCGKFLKKCK